MALIVYYTAATGNITKKVAGENVTYDSKNNTFRMFLPVFSSSSVEITVSPHVETLKDFESFTVATNKAEITKTNDDTSQ
jgi:hypothetical protein